MLVAPLVDTDAVVAALGGRHRAGPINRGGERDAAPLAQGSDDGARSGRSGERGAVDATGVIGLVPDLRFPGTTLEHRFGFRPPRGPGERCCARRVAVGEHRHQQVPRGARGRQGRRDRAARRRHLPALLHAAIAAPASDGVRPSVTIASAPLTAVSATRPTTTRHARGPIVPRDPTMRTRRGAQTEALAAPRRRHWPVIPTHQLASEPARARRPVGQRAVAPPSGLGGLERGVGAWARSAGPGGVGGPWPARRPATPRGAARS